MADTKITGLTALDAFASGDLLPMVDDPSGTPTTKKATINQVAAYVMGGTVTVSANGRSLIAGTYSEMRALLDLEAGTDFYSKSGADAAFQPLASVLTNTTASFTTAQETKLGHITVTQAVDLDAIETRVNALDAAVILKGTWDASASTFPGSGSAQAGESWIVSVAGTVGGVAFAVGDRIIAITDNASTSTFANNWFKADYTDQVLTVAGRTGTVTLALADLTDASANGRSLVAAADYAAMRALLDLEAGTDFYSKSAADAAFVAASSLGSGVATFLGTPSSANLRSALTDETGTGAAVFANMPTFVGTKETVYTITDGAAFEINPANGAIQIVTLGASRTPAATSFAAGQYVILGIDDGSGNTINWSTVNPTWLTDSGAAPTLATSGYTWIVMFKVSSTIYAARIA